MLLREGILPRFKSNDLNLYGVLRLAEITAASWVSNELDR